METPDSIPQLKYRPLDRDKNEIRLLRIFPHDSQAAESQVTCELFHASLDSHPSFKALSYTWGRSDGPQHDITLNTQKFKVHDNLYHALQKFQSKWIDCGKPLVLWVDAICIDQKNTPEQSHEVTRMKLIYERAEQVLVWLGVAAECCEQAFDLVHELEHCPKSYEEAAKFLSHPDIVGITYSLSCLSYRDYWRRMWIVQELVVAREIVIYCGNRRMNGNALLDAQRLLRSQEVRHSANRNTRDELNVSDSITIRGLSEFRDFRGVLDSRENFSHFDCIRYHYEQQCKDEKDMIYGLVALAASKSTSEFHADYRQTYPKVYTDFTEAELKHSKRLDILSWRHGSNSVELPSWVPDWSINCRRPLHYFLDDPKFPQYAPWAGGHGKADFYLSEENRALVFKGIHLGTIEKLEGKNEMKDEMDQRYKHTIKAWWQMVRSVDDSIPVQVAFMRTMLFDRISDETLGLWSKPEFLRGALHDFLWSCWQDPAVAASLDFATAKCNELSSRIDGTIETELEDLRQQWYLCIQSASNYLWDRELFLNENGIMGMVPKAALAGDTICIAPGCSTPLILRRVDGHYILIGEAYIDQFMNGEAMEKLGRQEVELQIFELR